MPNTRARCSCGISGNGMALDRAALTPRVKLDLPFLQSKISESLNCWMKRVSVRSVRSAMRP